MSKTFQMYEDAFGLSGELVVLPRN